MSKPDSDVVIVGGSHAGCELSFRLRHGGFTGKILLISAEAHLPYQRPPLSKAFLAGETTAEQLLIRASESYDKNDIAGVLLPPLSRLNVGNVSCAARMEAHYHTAN